MPEVLDCLDARSGTPRTLVTLGTPGTSHCFRKIQATRQDLLQPRRYAASQEVGQCHDS